MTERQGIFKDSSLVGKYVKRGLKTPVFEAWLLTSGKSRRVKMAGKLSTCSTFSSNQCLILDPPLLGQEKLSKENFSGGWKTLF